MKFTTTPLLAIFVLLISSSGFSQEYDFEIPEEEEAKIEFNGNLDAKWSFLQTQLSSPFLGLQFYDISDKNDYLSQYRLDFYLNGVYRHKQVSFFMKTFYQYNKEGELAPSFFELYGSLNLTPRISMSIGKRRFNWGKGYAFNPAGYINAEKDPENPDLALAGKSSVYLSYNRSFASQSLQNFSLSAVLLPPEAYINDKFAAADSVGLAFKAYFLFKNIDIDLMTYLRKNQPRRIGLDFSTNVKENIEIHAEFSYAQDENKFSVVQNSITQNKLSGGSYLLGTRYLNQVNTTFILEYYHNNIGLSKTEFSIFLSYLQNSLDSENENLINMAKLNLSTHFRSKTLMKDYLYLKVIQPEPFGWLYTSISLFSIFNVVDNSFTLSPQFTYKPFTNFEFLFWPTLFYGGSDTEYGSKQFNKKVEVWLRFYF
jgi:hypothetical protein